MNSRTAAASFVIGFCCIVSVLVFFSDIIDSPQIQPHKDEFTEKKTVRFEQVASIGVDQDGFSYQGEEVQLLPCGNIALVSNRRETDVGSQSHAVVNMFERSSGHNWRFRETVYACEEGLGGVTFRVSGDGKTLVIGCFGNMDFESKTRVLYLLESKKWSVDSTALKSDGKGFDAEYFGSSVSISHDGNTIALGSVGENKENGTVYIFSKSSFRFKTYWQKQQVIRLNAPDSSGVQISD